MANPSRKYLISLGSNIDPRNNIPRAIEALAGEFGRLWVSRVIATTPYDVWQMPDFLNALAVFSDAREPDVVKHQLNRIEEALGRDRSAPERSVSPRPIDLDILASGGGFSISAQCNNAPYLRAIANDFENPATKRDGIQIKLPNGVVLGDRPAAINVDTTTGQIVIGE